MLKVRILNNSYFYLAILMLLSLVLFYRTGSFGFISVWDDNLNVLDNPYIRDFSWQGIRKIFSPDIQVSEPRLTMFTYAVDYQLWKLNPKMYHLGNVLLHMANVILVFFLAKKIIRQVKIAALVAALFAFHPYRIESVAWVSGRKDLLYAFFLLLALLAYINYINKQKPLILLLVVFLSYLSFLSKIQAVAIPLILFLLDYFYSRKISAITVFEKILVFSVLAFQKFSMAEVLIFILFYLILYYNEVLTGLIKWSTGKIRLSKNSSIEKLICQLLLFLDFLLFFYILIWVFASENLSHRYLILLTLGFFYLWFVLESYLVHKEFESRIWLSFKKYHRAVMLAALITVLVMVFAFYGNQVLRLWSDEFLAEYPLRKRIFMSGYAFFQYFFSGFFPVENSSLRPYPDSSTVFLPKVFYVMSVFSLLLLGLIAWIIKRYKNLRRQLIFGFMFFLVNISLVLHIIPIEGKVIIAERYTYVASVGLFLMMGFALNSIDFVKQAKFRLLIPAVFVLLSIFYYASFRYLSVWKNDITLLNHQVEKNPDYEVAYLNRSVLHINRGDYMSAINDLDMAVNLNPNFYQAYYNRGLAFSKINVFDKAAENCTQCLRINPLFAEAHYLRAFCEARSGRYIKAITGYTQAIKINPLNHLYYFNRANAMISCLMYQPALKDYNKAIILRNDFPDAYNGRGVALYFTGEYLKSLTDFNKAIQLNPGNGNFYFNRGLAYKALGDIDNMCKDMRASLERNYTPAKTVLEQQCNGK